MRFTTLLVMHMPRFDYGTGYGIVVILRVALPLPAIVLYGTFIFSYVVL